MSIYEYLHPFKRDRFGLFADMRRAAESIATREPLVAEYITHLANQAEAAYDSGARNVEVAVLEEPSSRTTIAIQ